MLTMKNKINILKQEIKKELIGQDRLIDSLLIGLLSDGHILLEGVPGLAKTTAVKALSKSLNMDFKRVQFTPDLLPSDILGGEIYDMKSSSFSLNKGPIFTNLLLADEINRAPAKVQSGLLEVMQERQVTIGRQTHQMQTPFLVLATQNPIEDEGAYLLSAAQLDRFMFKVMVDYTSPEDEYAFAMKVASEIFEQTEAVVDAETLARMKARVKNIHIDENLSTYIVNLIIASRDAKSYRQKGDDEDIILYGASPRASIDLIKASKASAFVRGNAFVSPIDIAFCVRDILRHRLVLSFQAQSEGISVDDAIDRLLLAMPIT